jgi:DNA uptake protein ComE-like DNA-binding protein
MPVWSFGLLAFAPFLRLALARRTGKDWRVFAAYLAAVVAEVILASSPVEKGTGSGFFAGFAIVLMGTAAVHAFMSFRPATDMIRETARLSSSQPNQHALATAQARVGRRAETRELARTNPVLARELRIGRPDLPRDYDDGGLVDVNHVPVEILTSGLELTAQEATAVVAARTQLGRFTSLEELTAFAELAPDRVDAVGDLLWFG